MNNRILFSLLISIMGCSHTVPFLRSSVVPAATGYVEVSKDQNENTKLILSIEHLAKPEQLTPPRKTYVLWADTVAGPKSLGQVIVDKNDMVSLSTLVYSKEFRLFLTAETHPETSMPGPQSVLSTETIFVK